MSTGWRAPFVRWIGNANPIPITWVDGHYRPLLQSDCPDPEPWLRAGYKPEWAKPEEPQK